MLFIHFLLTFIIVLIIFSRVGFSYDKYVDVTYEKFTNIGDFETTCSDVYTSRFQFYLIGFSAIVVGALMSFTGFVVGAFLLYISNNIINYLKKRSPKDNHSNLQARKRIINHQKQLSYY